MILDPRSVKIIERFSIRWHILMVTIMCQNIHRVMSIMLQVNNVHGLMLDQVDQVDPVYIHQVLHWIVQTKYLVAKWHNIMLTLQIQ